MVVRRMAGILKTLQETGCSQFKGSFLIVFVSLCGANCAWPCLHSHYHFHPIPEHPLPPGFWAFAWLPFAFAGFREKWKLCQEVNWLFRFKAFFNLYSVFVVNTNTFSFVSPTAATMRRMVFRALFSLFRRFLHLLKSHSAEMTSCGTEL